MLYILKPIKKRIFRIVSVDDGTDLVSNFFDKFILFLISVNVILVILETFSGFPNTVLTVFKYVEIFSVVIFTLEYALRLWTADYVFPEMKPFKARLRYIFSFMAIVDLLAIAPFFLPFLIRMDLRVLRMIRLLRVLRILKANRYTNALSSVGHVIKNKSAQLVSAMSVILILMIMASVLMYNLEYEAQPEIFENAFSALWWAVATFTTVGYGDIYPVTITGKILSSIIAFLGIGLVAVPTGIISAGFVEQIGSDNEKAGAEKHFCHYCGKKLK